MKKIKVLIVDDSALVRKMLTEMLNSAADIEVVGVAHDPIMARDKIKMLSPDVLTLDIEMPRMDGVTFLANLMRLRPMPVVMVSTLTEKGADITLEALALGAVDFISKPKTDIARTLENYTDELVEKVRTASQVRVSALAGGGANFKPTKSLTADAILEKKNTSRHFKTTDRILAIGASTGGTEAIKDVLMMLPPDTPGTVISQHIPEAFSGPFANRMNGISAMTVCEAKDGQQIVTGHVYIAPGNRHLLVERDGARFICRLNDGPEVNRHKPSVDVMFRSIAQNVGSNSVAVILTGMGNDGAAGMKEMHEAGSPTIAQDEKSSVVWGMPGSAVKLGCVDTVLPLDKIAASIMVKIKSTL